MGICSPYVSDSIGRVSSYNSTSRPTSGTDYYVGKMIYEPDTGKVMILASTGPDVWREVIDAGGWETYTPAVGGTGFAVVNGTITGRYRTQANMVEFIVSWTWGSTDTSGAGPLTLSTPVTISATLAGPAMSGDGGYFFDTSTSAYYPLTVLYNSTTTVTPRVVTYNGAAAGTAYATLTSLSNTVPVAPATGDVIAIKASAFIA